jgi:hypothetical protein
MEAIRCPETSETNSQPKPYNIPEERRYSAFVLLSQSEKGWDLLGTGLIFQKYHANQLQFKHARKIIDIAPTLTVIQF